jgi:general secretion pathway protein C
MKFDLHYLLSAKYAQWISFALIFLFSALILVEFLTLRFSPAQVSVVPATTIEISSGTKSGSFDFILKASLFGIYVSNDLNEDTVKKSMLNVTLVGILFADKIADSQVIIRSASGEEKTYRIGDTIPGDAVIKRITASGILVKRNGALERLSLPTNELTFEPVPKPLKEE